jgi:chloramphenicol O-acetyltransferase type A
MRQINLETWPRREQFELFNTFNHPHFNMCVNVDLTAFKPFLMQRDVSFTVAIVYVISRASNAIPEFRYRIRDGNVIEHEVVHPSVTILVDEDLFSFCTMDYHEDFAKFATGASTKIAQVKEHPTLTDGPGQDDLLFMTALPWVSFTSFTHPMRLHPADSVPRFAWGKFFQEGKSLKMPLSVQGHHALMDGLHMARFYAYVQNCLDRPQNVLSGGPEGEE